MSERADLPPYLEPDVLEQLTHLDLVAREVVEGVRVGAHRSPLRGFSTEFAQHRPYVAGDEVKHVDWRVYSRTGRYHVKLYEAETNFSCSILLDASSSMRFGSGQLSKLEYAKRLAASLAYLVVDQRDAVGLGLFDAELRDYAEPRSSQSTVHRLARGLAELEPVPRTDVAAVLHEVAHRIPRRGLVILISDLLDEVDGFLEGLHHLRHRGHDVSVMHTLDPQELSFPFDGTARFEGLEGEAELMTQPRRVREAYLRELHAFLDRVRIACEKMGADYVLADTSRPLAGLITAYLSQRAHGRGGR